MQINNGVMTITQKRIDPYAIEYNDHIYEVTNDYFERAKNNSLDLEQFISTAQDALDDLDMAILDEYSYMPLLLKDDLAERYQDYINQANKLIGGIKTNEY